MDLLQEVETSFSPHWFFWLLDMAVNKSWREIIKVKWSDRVLIPNLHCLSQSDTRTVYLSSMHVQHLDCFAVVAVLAGGFPSLLCGKQLPSQTDVTGHDHIVENL